MRLSGLVTPTARSEGGGRAGSRHRVGSGDRCGDRLGLRPARAAAAPDRQGRSHVGEPGGVQRVVTSCQPGQHGGDVDVAGAGRVDGGRRVPGHVHRHPPLASHPAATRPDADHGDPAGGELAGECCRSRRRGALPGTPGGLALVGAEETDPSEHRAKRTIERAAERGIVILDVTQCLSGEVALGLYEASAGLLALGVVGGMDLTPEAALAKLAFVLGQESNSQIAADKVQLDWRGEQQATRVLVHYGGGRLAGSQGMLLAPTCHVDLLPSHTHARNIFVTVPLRSHDVHAHQAPRQPTRFTPTSHSTLAPGQEDTPTPTCDYILGDMSVNDPAGKLEGAAILIAGIQADAAVQFEAYLESPAGISHPLGRGRSDAGAPYLLIEVTESVRPLLDAVLEGKLKLVNSSSTPVAWKRLDLALRVST